MNARRLAATNPPRYNNPMGWVVINANAPRLWPLMGYPLPARNLMNDHRNSESMETSLKGKDFIRIEAIAHFKKRQSALIAIAPKIRH